MKTQKYQVNQHLIGSLLSLVTEGEIAIPEIQRPFVWDASQVRDLIDSLYQGYPIGYLIAWRNPNVRLKDGRTAEGKKILIDGQQRITALSAAILGNIIVTKEYKKSRIKIAFNPIQEKFEVHNNAIEKDKIWIKDIAEIFKHEFSTFEFVENYVKENPEVKKDLIFSRLGMLNNIINKQIGLIELDSDLDIEVVTEIFIRINSQGVVLSQADFAMSKLAANETYEGNILRKCIDYFCHLAVAPEFYPTLIDLDKDFTKTEYFSKIKWLKNEIDDTYDPSYSDMIRVAFTSEFNRGRLSDLVSLLSGRNFETRTYEEEIVADTFNRLRGSIYNFMNETNFKRFVMIINSAGFISSKLIRSQNALNFAYILYLKLRSLNYDAHLIEKYVQKWYVLSVLTSRYSSSPESQFDWDVKAIANKDFGNYLNDVESADLSDAFWNSALIQSMNTSVASSPIFHVLLAAQVRANDKGFLSKEVTVRNLIEHKGDIHHIFPKSYLKKKGLTRGKYNQIANYVYTQTEINIKIGNKAPNIYFAELLDQVNGNGHKYGGIEDMNQLKENMKANCIPESIFNMTIDHYEEFLTQRRKLMSSKIKEYYFSL